MNGKGGGERGGGTGGGGGDSGGALIARPRLRHVHELTY